MVVDVMRTAHVAQQSPCLVMRGGLALSGMRFASHFSHGTIIEEQRALSITQTKLWWRTTRFTRRRPASSRVRSGARLHASSSGRSGSA
jgi:hypothetical protein